MTLQSPFVFLSNNQLETSWSLQLGDGDPISLKYWVSCVCCSCQMCVLPLFHTVDHNGRKWAKAVNPIEPSLSVGGKAELQHS